MANATAGASHIISFYKANPLTQPLTHITLSLSLSHLARKLQNKEQRTRNKKNKRTSEFRSSKREKMKLVWSPDAASKAYIDTVKSVSLQPHAL